MQIDIRSLLRQPGEVLAIKFGPDQANNSNKPNQANHSNHPNHPNHPHELSHGILLKDFGSYKFPELLSFRGELSSETDGILHLRGEISLTYDSECVRCLRPVHETIVIPVDEEIYPLGYKADLHRLFPVLDPEELADNTADDPEEMVFHDNKYVDLEKLLQDQALLALPIGVYCESDCPGLCPTCGRRKDDPDCHCEETVVINSPFDKLRELM